MRGGGEGDSCRGRDAQEQAGRSVRHAGTPPPLGGVGDGTGTIPPSPKLWAAAWAPTEPTARCADGATLPPADAEDSPRMEPSARRWPRPAPLPEEAKTTPCTGTRIKATENTQGGQARIPRDKRMEGGDGKCLPVFLYMHIPAVAVTTRLSLAGRAVPPVLLDSCGDPMCSRVGSLT